MRSAAAWPPRRRRRRDSAATPMPTSCCPGTTRLSTGTSLSSGSTAGRCDQYPVADGSVFLNNNTCLCIYSEKEDPTQERTAREIARFSQKDAETMAQVLEAMADRRDAVGTDGLAVQPARMADTAGVPQPPDRRVSQDAGSRPRTGLYAPGGQRQTVRHRSGSTVQELQYSMLRAVVSYVHQSRRRRKLGRGLWGWL